MQDYVVIDLEMTGLNAKTDHILEVGAVRVRNHQAVDKFGAILCQNVKIPEKVTELTGITEAMVQGGMKKEEAMRQFFEFIGEDIIVGQNVIFDYGFLKQWAVNHNMPLERSAVDTLKLARKFLPKEQKKDLESLCACFGVKRENAHRAFDDAYETWQVYEALRERYEEESAGDFMPKPLLYKAKNRRRQRHGDKILKRICGALSDQTAGKFPGDDKERGVKTDGPADRHLWENAIKYYVWNEPDVYEA